MSEDIVYMVACKNCGSLQPITTVPTEWIDGQPVAWEHRCATCAGVCGVAINGGTLDLGVVRDSTDIDSGGFQVFTDPPPGH